MPGELWSYCRRTDRWLGAGEDWPQAYRHSPISFDEALACVVVFWHDDWQEPAFQIYSSLLFGLPLAATSFNRYSRFAEALGRRLLRCLVSMYYDDAHLTDLASNGVSSQWSFLDYDFTEVGSHDHVQFWVRERLETKVIGMIRDAKFVRGADTIASVQAVWHFELSRVRSLRSRGPPRFATTQRPPNMEGLLFCHQSLLAKML